MSFGCARFPPLAAVRRVRFWAVGPTSVFRAGVDVVVRPEADIGNRPPPHGHSTGLVCA